MSTPDLNGPSPALNTPSDSREKLQDLLNAVSEFHDTAIQDLQAKVYKLKKERCLDAQRLSEFHSKNQQLREQQKILEEKIKQLEDRVHSGPCDRCTLTERHIKKTNTEFEDTNKKNLFHISELEADRKTLKDENRRLSRELEQLRKSGSPQNMSTEAEEGMIPDSPLQPLSLPVISKLKRKKEQNHVRYAEKPLSFSHPEPSRGEPLDCNGRNVLVAETCEIDVTCFPEANHRKHFRTVVPETCRIDPPEQDSECDDDDDEDDDNELHTSLQQTKHPDGHDDRTAIATEVNNDDSPCILRIHPLGSREKQQPSTDNTPHTPLHNSSHVPVTGKRKHTDCRKREQKNSDVSLENPDETEIKGLIFASTPANCHTGTKHQKMTVRHSETETVPTNQDSKKRKCLEADLYSQRKSSHQNQNNTPFPYDQSWSVDPGADLAQYETESSLQPEPIADLETMDTDCTFVSHSLLLGGQKKTGLTGIGQKANDSLADIFDKTAYEEYESCPQDVSSDANQDSVYEEEREEEEIKEAEEQIVVEFRQPADKERVKCNGDASNRNRSFACVDVVRKKDERRKLKGHYCKECEIYYADLPEEERQNKLSSCSRHRYRYIPPSTPENFWEVGFPSTQTCVERGYIKEEDQPDVRIRRRRPYFAMFSPKVKSQKEQH
ncbi:DNA endonuclease RBBP8 [Myxocyprinus asiaticus]|uniref:DNA endonuclease RBBP8 n=1 Tax=Myxocyprinus asiaticus TaxID=70543 RepID=UPI0022229ED7|nr:DNA endonuclease RBBP8 [Myxocyprinus asiaticus]